MADNKHKNTWDNISVKIEMQVKHPH